MIIIENVHKSFGKVEVLKGVNLTVEKGEVLCLIGGSGSGKSTLLMCINALETIQSGRITVDGIDVHAPATNRNKLRTKLGIVFSAVQRLPASDCPRQRGAGTASGAENLARRGTRSGRTLSGPCRAGR